MNEIVSFSIIVMLTCLCIYLFFRKPVEENSTDCSTHTYGKWREKFEGSSFQRRSCTECNHIQEKYI